MRRLGPVGPGSGGGETIEPGAGSGFTAGAVLIGASDGSLGQDATELFWDASTNRLGIGTNTPASLLHVTGSVSPVANANAYLAQVGGTLVEAGSGTHAVMAGLACLAPTLTAGAAATTILANLYAAANPTGGTYNLGLFAAGDIGLGATQALRGRLSGGAFTNIFQMNGNDIEMFNGSGSARVQIRSGGSGIVRFVDSNVYFVSEVEIDGPFNHDGTTFGALGATPATQRAHVVDPSGGATIDAESRTAIAAINVTLETFGFHAAA